MPTTGCSDPYPLNDVVDTILVVGVLNRRTDRAGHVMAGLRTRRPRSRRLSQGDRNCGSRWWSLHPAAQPQPLGNTITRLG